MNLLYLSNNYLVLAFYSSENSKSFYNLNSDKSFSSTTSPPSLLFTSIIPFTTSVTIIYKYKYLYKIHIKYIILHFSYYCVTNKYLGDS